MILVIVRDLHTVRLPIVYRELGGREARGDNALALVKNGVQARNGPAAVELGIDGELRRPTAG